MFNLQFNTRSYRHCVETLENYIFLEAYKKHKGNMAAVRQELNVSSATSYRWRARFSAEQLKNLLQKPQRPKPSRLLDLSVLSGRERGRSSR